MLPNFLVLGAQKAGTTTLARFFELHSDIHIPKKRETSFFTHPHLYSKGAWRYEAEFFGGWNGEKAVGEKTPEYLVDPDVPLRVRRTLGPALKFIVCLRSPAARAHSGYRQNLSLSRETLSFDDALMAEPARIVETTAHLLTYGYLARGFYARQIENWIKAYPDFLRQTLFIDFDDLVSDQARAFDSVADHLGVARLAVPNVAEGKPNVGGGPLGYVEGGLFRPDKVTWGGQIVNGASNALLDHAMKNDDQSSRTEKLGKDREIALNRQYFAQDIARLGTLLGRDFSKWLG